MTPPQASDTHDVFRCFTSCRKIKIVLPPQDRLEVDRWGRYLLVKYGDPLKGVSIRV